MFLNQPDVIMKNALDSAHGVPAQLTVRPYATQAMYRSLSHFSLICWDGNAVVRSVSWVSSLGDLRKMLSTNAAWSAVAAHAVMRYPVVVWV